jgi:DNA repair exonuclease SbcCD ATPase subunit
VEVIFGPGATCLAGANGIGKSTFLTSVLYALTGMVTSTTVPFQSVREFGMAKMNTAEDYFAERTTERHREDATVEVEFKLGQYHYKLSRPVNTLDTLSHLAIYTEDGETIYDSEALLSEPTDIQKRYTTYIPAHSGLETFNQFSFLLHYVATFDERRFLLFFNPRVLEQTIYILFGNTADIADRVDKLKSRANKLDSNARNAKYQASELRKRIKELHAEQQKTEGDQGESEYAQLLAELEADTTRLDSLRATVTDLNDELTRLSTQRAELESDYKHVFNLEMGAFTDIRKSPLIRQTVANRACDLCGTAGEEVVESVLSEIETHQCPLCSSPLTTSLPTPYNSERLASVDYALVSVSEQILDNRRRISRIRAEIDDLEISVSRREATIKSLEEIHPSLSGNEADGETKAGIRHLIKSYEASIRKLESDARKYRKSRDELKDQVIPLQEQLELQYASVEAQFLPMFRQLAGQFLGLPLSITLDTSKAGAITFVLTVDGRTRRGGHQLSESQRFFVDIALRMSLLTHISTDGSPCTLFVDTPEGSLDIAYESRAGTMFAEFVKKNQKLVLTANINTSQLLINLARSCGPTRMRIEPMTRWRHLTEVQLSGLDLFSEALSGINSALTGANL